MARETKGAVRAVPVKRERHGCDCCKADMPTQWFHGSLDDDLWLCRPCLEVLFKWTEKQKREAWKGRS